MTQSQRLDYLTEYLFRERGVKNIGANYGTANKRRLLRGLMNIRPPAPISGEFLKIQDEYLAERLNERGITKIENLTPVQKDLYIWQGDITTLAADAIVNAANSALLGCFHPRHGCIDNAIHTYAGVQLRLECAEIMKGQGYEEPIGRAKITKAYNLPSKYVLHTVGPIIYDRVTDKDRELLADCYKSCLSLAAEKGLKSVAFCCISTGEYRFPDQAAAQIAVKTVKDYLNGNNGDMEVVFNVFKNADKKIYEKLLK